VRMRNRNAQLGLGNSNCGLIWTSVRSTRPLSSLLAGTLTSAVICTHLGFSARVVFAGVAMSAVTAFGFVINDILDYPKDVAAGVQRPIATGALSIRSAGTLAVVLLILSFLLSVILGTGSGTLAFTAFALLIYTPAAQRFPLLKGIYVAGLSIMPLAYASVASGAAYAWPPYALLACFVFGREVLMDANEVGGDRKAGMITIPAVIGQGRARWIGAAIMVSALSGLQAIATGRVGRTAAISSVVSLVTVFAWPRLSEAKRVELSRLPMLAAAVAIACS
jgi:4-hydroxybenzoate polyprenyltransferase